MIAQDAQQKNPRIDKTAYVFPDMHMATTFVTNAKKDDIVAGVPFLGETIEVAEVLELAKK